MRVEVDAAAKILPAVAVERVIQLAELVQELGLLGNRTGWQQLLDAPRRPGGGTERPACQLCLGLHKQHPCSQRRRKVGQVHLAKDSLSRDRIAVDMQRKPGEMA